jgi:hypothetical protein
MSVFRCTCRLVDCAYYQAVPTNPDECDCRHPDKHFHPKNPCPLYKKDWLGKAAELDRIKNLMKRRR